MRPLLVTCVGVRFDLPLLPHWLRHYLALGVDPEDICVLLNSEDEADPLFKEAERILESFGVSHKEHWAEPYTSAGMWEKRRSLQKRKAAPGQWVLSADIDEFHEYPDDLHVFLAACEAMGVSCVQGPFIDRLAPGGALAPVAEEPGVEEQFPLLAEAMWSLGGRGAHHDQAGTVKIMAIKSEIMPSRGGHHPQKDPEADFLYGQPLHRFRQVTEPGFRFSLPTRVHHYHWTESLIPRLEKRLATQGASSAGSEYGRKQIASLKRHDGVKLDEVALCERPVERDWQRAAEAVRQKAAREEKLKPVTRALDFVRARVPL